MRRCLDTYYVCSARVTFCSLQSHWQNLWFMVLNVYFDQKQSVPASIFVSWLMRDIICHLPSILFLRCIRSFQFCGRDCCGSASSLPSQRYLNGLMTSHVLVQFFWLSLPLFWFDCKILICLFVLKIFLINYNYYRIRYEVLGYYESINNELVFILKFTYPVKT